MATRPLAPRRVTSYVLLALIGGMLATLSACDLLLPQAPANNDDTGLGVCSNTCAYAHDGECDDGGPNSDYSLCAYGTDCADCGARDGTDGNDDGDNGDDGDDGDDGDTGGSGFGDLALHLEPGGLTGHGCTTDNNLEVEIEGYGRHYLTESFGDGEATCGTNGTATFWGLPEGSHNYKIICQGDNHVATRSVMVYEDVCTVRGFYPP